MWVATISLEQAQKFFEGRGIKIDLLAPTRPENWVDGNPLSVSPAAMAGKTWAEALDGPHSARFYLPLAEWEVLVYESGSGNTQVRIHYKLPYLGNWTGEAVVESFGGLEHKELRLRPELIHAGVEYLKRGCECTIENGVITPCLFHSHYPMFQVPN